MHRAVWVSLIALGAIACANTGETPARPPPQTIRCAVVGGMTETGFWPELAARYERLTGNTIQLAATGPKPVVIDAFRKGGIDLLTVHASDAIINLVADGLAVDPQPWLHNDLVIVGPATDPAGVRGEHDAVVAIGRIIERGTLLVHASMGADGVLHDLLETAKLTLPADRTILYTGERPQEVLGKASTENAYTLVGRIPFITGKIPHNGLELMVQGDVRLRRPYLVVVAAGPANDPRLAAARDFVAYLRDPTTQAWIATFGKGKYDDASLFFPMQKPGPPAR